MWRTDSQRKYPTTAKVDTGEIQPGTCTWKLSRIMTTPRTRIEYIAPFFTGGQTVYRLVIDPVVSYNLSVGYRFSSTARHWLRNSRVRLGVINLTDETPPLSSGSFGYDPSVSQSLLNGRSWTFEISRPF